MPTLANAIRTEQWEVAAVLQVRALLELALQVPQDAIPQLMEALEGDPHDRQE